MPLMVARRGILIDIEWDAFRERSYGVVYPHRRVEFARQVSASWLGAELRVSGRMGARRKGQVLLVDEAECLRTKEDLVLSVPSSGTEPERSGNEPACTERAVVRALLCLPLRWLRAGGLSKERAVLEGWSVKNAKRVLRNPFSTVRSRLLSFGVADCLHQLLGGQRAERARVQAGMTCVLQRAVKQGWGGLQSESLRRLVAARLCIDRETLGPLEPYMDDAYRVDAQGIVSLRSVWQQVGFVTNQFGLNQMTLSTQTEPCIESLLSRRFSVVTGSAGSGKTRLLQQVATEVTRRGLSVALTALTGKAAKVLGQQGCTVHRLLGFSSRGFARRPLPYDVIIVDEAPMLTLNVLWHLLRVSEKAIVIFAGDVKQLGPVSGIAVYRDIVRQLPLVDLDCEQAAWACPIAPVERIQFRRDGDVLLYVERRLRSWLAEDLKWQVISPVHTTLLGTKAVNRMIQHIVNPFGEAVIDQFRVGDRVIVTKNIYQGDRHVCNGEMGHVTGCVGKQLSLLLGDASTVVVPVRCVELAYCLSVHKVQGSRFARVMVILPERAFPRFCQDRGLLEVARTRATEQTVCLVA